MPRGFKYTSLKPKMTDRQILANVRESLGEAIHSSFRHMGNSDEANVVYNAIHKMSGEEWGLILEYALDGLGVPQCSRLLK